MVTDRLEHPDMPGPSNEGAALVMGNTERQWHASYWPNKKLKLGQKAVDDMEVYRQQQLQHLGYAAPTNQGQAGNA